MKAQRILVLGALIWPSLGRAQTVGATTTLAPFAGRLYTPASGQSNIGFYGTDLGYTFKHGGNLRILFGDTWASNLANPIGLTADDSQGGISLVGFPTGNSVDAYVAAHPPGPGKLSWQAAAPPITFRVNFLNKVAPMPVYRDGVLLNMGTWRTPTAGFSNIVDAAFAIFDRTVVTECSGGGTPTCGAGFTCDTGMGSCSGFTGESDLPCVLGTSRCSCVAVTGGGMCQDRTSSMYSTTEDGRVLSVALKTEVGNADPNIYEQYYTQTWSTNKFINPAVRTVNDFLATRVNGAGNDYRPADGVAPTANEKVFLWGRPNFVGLGANDQSTKLYFSYVDMPHYASNGHFAWAPKYFTGLSAGVPQFSTSQAAAVPLDLSGGSGNTIEQYDIPNQMTISWVIPLNKWVMLYGGDLSPAVLNLFLGPNYTQAVHDPDGAIHARFASQPWGPWSAPVQVLKGGDPSVSPPVAGTQYASGGILYHPGCTTNCAPRETALGTTEYGRLYGANVVDSWTMSRTGGAADIYWNVSTWNPYQVVLMKTRLNP